MASDEAQGALGGVATGASTGASIGMIGGPVGAGMGALIGAGVGLVSGFLGGSAKHRAARQARKQAEAHQRRLQMLASPEHLAEVMQHLGPLMRQIVASGLGPQFQQEIAKGLAQHGLTGTGAGEAIRAGAEGAPSLFANQMTAEKAQGVVGREIQAEEAGSTLDPSVENRYMENANPLMDTLLGSAKGYEIGKLGTKPNAGLSAGQAEAVGTAYDRIVPFAQPDYNYNLNPINEPSLFGK